MHESFEPVLIISISQNIVCRFIKVETFVTREVILVNMNIIAFMI